MSGPLGKPVLIVARTALDHAMDRGLVGANWRFVAHAHELFGTNPETHQLVFAGEWRERRLRATMPRLRRVSANLPIARAWSLIWPQIGRAPGSYSPIDLLRHGDSSVKSSAIARLRMSSAAKPLRAALRAEQEAPRYRVVFRAPRRLPAP